jgi:hypothetical protein
MNGTVKVVLVCGFSVVFGFYAFMIQGMNNKIMQVGDQKSYYTEARMIATAGLNHAIYTMRTQSLWWSTGTVYVKNNLLAGGDTVSYIIEKPSSLPSDEARVTVTADFNGVTAKQIAVIKNISGMYSSPCRVQVVKVYVYPYQLPASELPS